MDTEGLNIQKAALVGIIKHTTTKTLSTPTLLTNSLLLVLSVVALAPLFFFLHYIQGVLGESSIIAPNVLPFKAVVDFPNAPRREVRGVEPV